MYKIKNFNKKFLSIILIASIIIAAFGINIYTKAEASILSLDDRVVSSKAVVRKGDIIEVKYKIDPISIEAKKVDNSKQKDIIFAIDTSGSMSEKVSGKSKLNIMKDVTKSFASKFKDDNKSKLGVVEYGSYALRVMQLNSVDSSNIFKFNSNIDSLIAGGSTNTGDALRIAYNMLRGENEHDKYIILMSDGEAEAFSYNYSGYGNYNFYTGTGENGYGYDVAETLWNNSHTYASPDYRNDSLRYAAYMAENIAVDKNGIKTFVIGFGDGANSKNKQVADAAKGTYYEAQNENTINSIYEQIQKIIEANVNGKAQFVETISNNLKVSGELPHGFKVKDNKVIGDIDNIYYTLSKDGKTYESNPLEFTIKYEVISDGEVCFGSPKNSSYVKLNVQDKEETKYYDELKINELSAEVNIEVSDSKGTLDKYITTEQNPQSSRYDKFVNEQNYKLIGDANASISVHGNDIDILEYQIKSYDANPKDLPLDKWNRLDLNREEFNDDVMSDKQGNLTWRGYDVNHLPTIDDKSKWEDNSEVYKNPYSDISLKPSISSYSKDSYGYWENIVPYTIKDSKGKDIIVNKRWITNSMFMKNMNIGGDYKEASKFWGYIKVDNTGYYNFGAYSDDGCKIFITVGGSTIPLVDMFYVQSSTFGTKNNVVYLEKEKYYPIHIEYFNWGGYAHFEMLYSFSKNYDDVKIMRTSTANRMKPEFFFPSKSTAPGEYTNIVFKGSKGIKFPTEPGKYYVAYRTGKKDSSGNIKEIQKSGFFGPFIVEAKAKLALTRNLEETGANKIGDEYKLTYTITPKDIPLIELFRDVKTGDNPRETYEIQNIKFQDEMPEDLNLIGRTEGIQVAVNNNKLVGTVPNSISYRLDKFGEDIRKAIYRAEPIKFSIYIRPEEAKEYLLKGTNSVITYLDIDGANRQGNFGDFNFSVNAYSDIVMQGLFKGKNSIGDYIKSSNDINAAGTMPLNLAMILDIKSQNSKINFNLEGELKENNITFKKYELSKGNIIEGSLEEKTVSSKQVTFINEAGFKLEQDKKYIIIYTIIPKNESGAVDITSKADNQNEKIMNIKLGNLPDIF